MPNKEELKQLIDTVLHLRRGTYLVVNTDVEANLIEQKPTMDAVREAISTPERKCILCDTVSLKVPGAGSGRNPIVMMVDDTGMLDGLPRNSLATFIAKMIRQYPHDIHGTAVIVNDEDFGE